MNPISLPEQIATITIYIFGTMLTGFLSSFIFSSKKPTPKTARHLSKALPCVMFGLLVVYCLKYVSAFSGAHGTPEFIVAAVTATLYLWKKQMLLSTATGMVVYMLLLQFVFQPR